MLVWRHYTATVKARLPVVVAVCCTVCRHKQAARFVTSSSVVEARSAAMSPAPIMDLVTEKNLRLSTAFLATLLAVFGFFIIVPLAVIQAGVGGRCLLYADSTTYGPRSVCTYVIVVAAVFQLLYSISRAILSVLMTWGDLKKKLSILTPIAFLLPCAVADIVAFVLTLVSAGVVSAGFSVMCSKIFYPKSDRCGTVDIYSAVSNSHISNYYVRLQVAEAGVWISLLLWLLVIVLDVLHLSLCGLLSDLPFSLPCLDVLNRRLQRAACDSSGTMPAPVSRPLAGDLSAVASKTLPPKRPVPPRPQCFVQPLITPTGVPSVDDEK